MFGLHGFDRRMGQVPRYSGKRVSRRLIFRKVHAIAEDRAGNLWFGEWGNGLDCLNPRTGDIKSYHHDPGNPSSLSHDLLERLLFAPPATFRAPPPHPLPPFPPPPNPLHPTPP